jgi:mono/diheme cytochrome c family protein
VRLRGLVGACAVLIAALAATGCGSGGLTDASDAAAGKELFSGEGQCASCHTLADAGARGVIGPNLDDAFKQSRVDGLGEGTIREVVRDQIAYPVVAPNTGSPGMPADLLTGDDADAVAAYVASVAGLPVRGGGAEAGGGTTTGGTTTGGTTTGEGEGGAPDGEAIFAEAGCGGCHTLKAANTNGTVGPNLDEAKPDKELVIDRVTNGQGAMPSFKDSYSAAQIAAVADYVVASTSG